MKIKKLHDQLSAENNPKDTHIALDEHHEKVVELEIDYLESDAIDDEGETHVESDLPTSDCESMTEPNISCVEDEPISEHFEKQFPPKPKVQILKLQTIEKIVYVSVDKMYRFS